MSPEFRNSFDRVPLPQTAGEHVMLGAVRGSLPAWLLAEIAQRHQGLVLAITNDVQQANRLLREITFFVDGKLPVTLFPDWETLPYDLFSPLPELVSRRLSTLHRLPQLKRGILIVAVSTLLQRLPPLDYVQQQSLLLEVGQKIDLSTLRRTLEQSSYQSVSQVFEHGEFAVRGSLIDLFPMGSKVPFRIDLLDEEIDSIRTFDPENQRTIERIEHITMLAAREFPIDTTAIERFRRNYRQSFEQDISASLIYREVSTGRLPGGIETYLPLFFDHTATLFNYLPAHTLTVLETDYRQHAESFEAMLAERYEQRRHDIERPILPPGHLFLNSNQLVAKLKSLASLLWQSPKIEKRTKGVSSFSNLDSHLLPPLNLNARATQPAGLLQEFLHHCDGRILFTAESHGRLEQLTETLASFAIEPKQVTNWQAFIDGNSKLAITVSPLENGVSLDNITLIPEAVLLGERVRRPKSARRKSDTDQIIRNLNELHTGAPVVHEDHGIGRFIGLQTVGVGGEQQEFLTLEYAGGDKLYVPVASLHLISRYTGASPENAPLHKLGSDTWEKAKRKAAQKARDVAAELLDTYARRKVSRGVQFPPPADENAEFAAAFEFETTPDQQATIDAILVDMASSVPMDRVVCGDVGFGKTEVAMRAAFHAAMNGHQVAILAPTTLLVQQHTTNFVDRFSSWPLHIESLSRFRSMKEQQAIRVGLTDGTIDIVIGTHALLNPSIRFKSLGLVIVDEEHRFGVRHKERLKALRTEINILTLTATPIPRTLNMAMSGLRDLSIIATPPVARHPIKTFISTWSDALIQEAIRREISRGGQVYFLHNEVATIDNMARRVQALVPEARLEVAHGQLREHVLERIMRDFYHQRFQILVCTTIIESGIDVHSANTIIMQRADKLGLAQLHQLRGRVGRSHHRAYAYLLTPPIKSMTTDAKKRLEAIESLEDLGAGFILATHDLEIRGAGELLGEEQSGQIAEVGYTLYTELLERAVKSIRQSDHSGLDQPLDTSLHHGTEVDLDMSALIPDNYLPDIHTRLVQYKRIASATTNEELRELQVEMIDRFGLLPQALKNLFAMTRLKLRIATMGVRKLDASRESGYLLFDKTPHIDFDRIMHLIQTQPNTFRLDGQNKLRFYGDFGDVEERVRKIETVLEKVGL